MELSRLLYATDLEEPKGKILDSFLEATRVGLREVAFLHIKGKDAAERYAQAWEPRFSTQGVKVWAHKAEGNLVTSVLKVGATDRFSLVVAEFEYEGNKRVSKSAIRRLIKGMNTPVLVVKQTSELLERTTRGIFDHVIFATDWSPVAQRAGSFLYSFDGLVREMDIVNVIRKKLTVGQMRELKRKLQETRRMFSSQGVDAEFHIYAGRMGEEIMLAARDYNATLIAMGTSCRPFRIFSESPSCKVAVETVVPVLLVP